MMCQFERAGEKNGRAVCRCTRPRCGRKAYSDDPTTCYAECGRRGGLGSLLAKALAKGWVVPFVKITPANYRRWKVACNFADACCCGERKIQLNNFGRRVVKPFRDFAARVKKWWKALPPAPPAE